jgi:release factor H-coupled RctB family protein
MIPGSRGTFSYLVNPIGDHYQNAYSLAHGAGRKWKRSDTKAHLSNRFKREDLIKTNLGSRVICEDKDLLYEEAPQAYKNIDIVIQDMVDAGLIEVIAVFRPVITYKTRRRT